MKVNSLSDFPVSLITNEIIPYCDLKSLVELSKTNRKFYIIVKKNPVWRKATELYFKKNYDKLYARMPQTLSFFHIFTAELRLLSIKQRAEVLEDMMLFLGVATMFNMGLTIINVAAPPACKGTWWLATKVVKFLCSGTTSAKLTLVVGAPAAAGAGLAITKVIKDEQDNENDNNW